MMTDNRWGIWVEGATEGWLTDGGYWDDNTDWVELPAAYPTLKEADAEARWFSKGSKHKYTPRKFTDDLN